MKPIVIFSLLFLFYIQTLFAQPKYEFRGVWVATVDNIDFPSSRLLSTQKQKDEFISLVEKIKKME
jgi:hypothetical protein